MDFWALNSDISKVKFINTMVYYNTQYGANAQSRLNYENNGAKTVTVTKKNSAILKIQVSNNSDFSASNQLVSTTDQTGTANIEEYKYVRIVLETTATGIFQTESIVFK